MIYIILIVIGLALVVWGIAKQKESLFAIGFMSAAIGFVFTIVMIIVSIDTTIKVFETKESMTTYLSHPDIIKTDNIHYIMEVEAKYNAALLNAQYKRTHLISWMFTEGFFIPESVMKFDRFDGDIKNQ